MKVQAEKLEGNQVYKVHCTLSLHFTDDLGDSVLQEAEEEFAMILESKISLELSQKLSHLPDSFFDKNSLQKRIDTSNES